MQNYTVWISPPENEHNLYMLCIHPSSPANVGSRVGGTLHDEDGLRDALSKNFPSGLNSVEQINVMIDGAKTGAYSLLNHLPWPFQTKRHEL
jgi:hypothetical protein